MLVVVVGFLRIFTPADNTTHPLLQYQQKSHVHKKSPCPKHGAGHILFIDDEPDLRELGRRYLEYLGYTVITASSGTEALTIFKNDAESFTAVVTDQAMPGIPGNILAENLLQIRTDIPIVLCTGHSTAVSEQQALSAGIKAYLTKPVSINSLANSLHTVIPEKGA